VENAAILLCGGKGSRMIRGGVTTHKPLLEIGGMPATRFVVEKLLSNLSFSQILIVVPTERKDEYEKAMEGIDCEIITQFSPLGTGNAVYVSVKHLSKEIENVYVSFGTQPLIKNETVSGSLEIHKKWGFDFTLATVEMENPYAPLIRDELGNVTGSLETHLDGVDKPEYGETNVGAYWATKRSLESVLVNLHHDLYIENKGKYNTISGELGYPNEMVRGCIDMGLKVGGALIATEEEMLGIKTPENLAAIRKIVGE
tara:strand:- start:1055 stop:1825 length:771 start_codon:yes stop_codon:yes gene_type:complete